MPAIEPIQQEPHRAARTSADETTERMLQAIRRILLRTAEHSRALARSSGLTVPQALCLRTIDELHAAGDVNLVKISEAMQLAPATVSRILDRLQAAGLVERRRSASDRRKVCLGLTTAGAQRLAETPRLLQAQFVHRFNQLADEDQTRLLTALQEVVEMMEADRIAAPPTHLQYPAELPV